MLVIDLSRLRKNRSEGEIGDFPEYFFNLSVVRDPFTVRRRPVLIFNTAIGPPPADAGFTINGGVERIPDDWEAIGMTASEIESRCLPFDEAAMEAFRKGEPVLWVWDHRATLSIGRQTQARLTNAMKDALAARTQKALTVFSIMRDRDQTPDPDPSTNPEKFEKLYFSKVLHQEAAKSGNYDRKGIPFFWSKGNSFKSIYGKSPIYFGRNLKEEIIFFDHFYGKKRYRIGFDDYEFYILEILYRGYQRARALEAAQHAITESKKRTKHLYKVQFAPLNGETHSYELTTFEYFLIALHSGYNPQQLHPGLAKFQRHLAVAAWLGRLGHGSTLALPPELCEPMIELLDGDEPVLGNDAEENADIRDLLCRHADLFAGVGNLIAIAEQVLEFGLTFAVLRRIYGRITRGRRRNELFEFTQETAPPDITLRALQMIRETPGNLKVPTVDGEDIVVRPFLPLAW